MRSRKEDKKYIIPLVIVPLLLAGFCIYTLKQEEDAVEIETENVVINEVCTDNNAVFIDADSEGCDYVELYNPTDGAVDISGWYLSDNGNVLAKHRLSGKVLEPGEFYVIYLGGSDTFTTKFFFSGPIRRGTEGETCDFAISSRTKGELYLCDPELNVADSVIIPVTGEDMCYARIADGSSEWGIRTPTPFASNDGASETLPALPEPIPPEFNDKRYVVNLTMLEEDLFDYETGIYTEGIVWDRFYEQDQSETGYKENDMALHSNWKMGWKRRARFQIYNKSGELVQDTNVHVSCHGNTSITDTSKSLNVYADDEEFSLFADGESQASILLRNGGSERFQTKLRDPVLQRAAKGLNVATQDFLCCDVFLNGVYLGPYSIMEKYSEDYLYKHYDVAPDKVAILKNPVGVSKGYAVAGTLTDMADFAGLWDYARDHDLSSREGYDYINERLDIDSFIDYAAVEMYVGNVDVYPNNNIYVWRAVTDDGNPYGDGRWRFMLQDLDSTSGADISYNSYVPDEPRMKIIISPSLDTISTNLIAWEGEGNESNFTTDPLFSGLMENEAFRQKFAERLLLISDEYFGFDRMVEIMDDAYHRTSDGWVDISGLSKDYLKGYVKDFYSFFEDRPDYIFDYFADDFGLDKDELFEREE